MTAITDANTFIDQNLINVPYQGVPGSTLNACLKTITNVFNSYATIASVNSLFSYALDGNFPAALMNAPNQVFTLNGGYVSISALLSFSSAQKYTVGPDGNYLLNAANGPAWDWSTGRRRLLIEAIGATNYWANSENAASWSTVNCTASSAAAAFGAVAVSTITQTAPNTSTAVTPTYGIDVVSGSIVSQTMGLLAVGSKTTASPAILGGSSTWGVNGDTVCTVLSGPGTATQQVGGVWTISGLSTTVPTFIRMTRTARTTENFVGLLYLQISTSGSAGDQIKVIAPQFEPGYGSSYIVSGASPTARAADVVTATAALLALLNGANCSLVMRGQGLSMAGNAGPLIAQYSGEFLLLGGDFGSVNFFNYSTQIYQYVTNTTGVFGVAATSTANSRKLSVANANPSGVVSDAAHGFGTGAASATLFANGADALNGYLDELVIWPIFASDAGLQAQARVYS